MARRARRAILTAIGAVVLLLILAVVLLPVLLPAERLRAIATERIRAATGGEVVLGDVSLKVLPRVRLVLGDSRIAVTAAGLRSAGHEPGALDSARVGLERLEVDLALWPLLQKRLEFGRIRVAGPDLALITRPVAADSTRADEAPAAEAPSPWGLALAGVEVRDGRVSWREQGTPRRVEATGWRQDISGSDLGLLVARAQRLAGLPPPAGARDDAGGDATLDLVATVARLDLAGFGERPLPPLTDLRLDAELGIPAAADRVTVAVRELSLPGWKLTARGEGDRARISIPELNLAADGGAVDLSGNLTLVDPTRGGSLRGILSGTVDVAGALAAVQPWLPPPDPQAAPPPEVTGHASVALTVADGQAPALGRADLWSRVLGGGVLDTLQVTAESADLTVAMPQLGEPLRVPRLEYRGDLAAAGMPQRVAVQGLAHPVVSGDGELALSIGREGAAHVADLVLQRVDLDALTLVLQQQAAAAPTQHGALWTPVSTAYAAPAAPRAAGEMIPPDLAVRFTAAAAEVVLLKMTCTDVRLQGDLARRVFTVPSVAANLGGGEIAGTARVDYATDPQGAASFTYRAANVPAAVLLEPYVPQLAGLWEGRLATAGQGSCRLGDREAVLRSLTLAGEVSGSDGRVDLRSLLGDIAPYLRGREDLLRITYSRYAQALKIDAGRVMVSDLTIDGPQTDWTGDGWLGLDGTLDLALHVKLPPGFVPDLGELAWVADALKDDRGRLDLGLRLTGRQTKPAVSLDLDTAQLRGKLEDEVQDKVRQGLGGLLDKLRGR